MSRIATHGLLAFTVAALFPACGSTDTNERVDLPPAPSITTEAHMGHEVGRLLSPDVDESKAAERRLLALTGGGRDALLRHAETIPAERDPRWLNVLDEHHALPEMPADQQVDFLLWKARRGGRVPIMRVQSALLDMAQADPDVLIRRVEVGGDGTELLAMALALAEEERAIPALLERYVNPHSDTERRAAAEALARLAGEPRRPRVRGSEREIRTDAARIRSWYRHHQEVAAAIAAEAEGETDG